MLSLWVGSSLLVMPRAASAGYLNDFGLGVASAISTFVYAPLKISYALVGGTFGCLGYLLSVGSLDVAKKIWVPSLGGSYVITPDMLQGDGEIRFFGSETAEAGPVDVVE
jgi:hypothetical protein